MYKHFFKKISKMIQQELVIKFAAFLGMLAVILGAFGAHALKKVLDESQLKSFETGIRYQMFHAIALLVLGLANKEVDIKLFLCFFIGTILFSFSIYGLVLSSANGKKLSFLGPITPIGGLILIIGWGLLLFGQY